MTIQEIEEKIEQVALPREKYIRNWFFKKFFKREFNELQEYRKAKPYCCEVRVEYGRYKFFVYYDDSVVRRLDWQPGAELEQILFTPNPKDIS